MDIVASLQDDHVNVAQIASLAREELRLLEAGETVDYSLLEDVMCYVTGCPDTHHHPTEDVVFERLKEIAPDTAEDVNSILAEHKEFIARGRRFLEVIRAAAEEVLVRREDLLHREHDHLRTLPPKADSIARAGGVTELKRVGGLHHEYIRMAA